MDKGERPYHIIANMLDQEAARKRREADLKWLGIGKPEPVPDIILDLVPRTVELVLNGKAYRITYNEDCSIAVLKYKHGEDWRTVEDFDERQILWENIFSWINKALVDRREQQKQKRLEEKEDKGCYFEDDYD